MRTTSEDIAFTQPNLWIIDEKLSFHRDLASDKQIRSMSPLTSDSKKRPDLLVIYDTPFLFVDSDAPFNSIIIIEFKRPMRKNLSNQTDDPIKQVYTYVRKITENEVTTHDGRRPININPGTRFYCYVIADLNKELNEVCKDKGLTISPDNLGYFGYNPNYNTYAEVISYDKLLLDANKRNSILFDQLGPPR